MPPHFDILTLNISQALIWASLEASSLVHNDSSAITGSVQKSETSCSALKSSLGVGCSIQDILKGRNFSIFSSAAAVSHAPLASTLISVFHNNRLASFTLSSSLLSPTFILINL